MQDVTNDGIELTLPASTSVIQLARLLASGVAARSRFDVDAVDDIRIGVDEMCSSLLEVSDGPSLTLRFTTDHEALEVWGFASRRFEAEVDPERFDLSRQILDVVVDEHRIDLDDDVVTFWVRKRRGQRA